MNIIIILLEEEGKMDTESLVGHVAITDGSRTIRERYTYVDSWFDALIRGLLGLRDNSYCIVDLIEEPKPLVFSVTHNELSLNYGEGTIRVGSIDSFERSLRSAADLFLDIVREEAGGASNEVLESIRRFASRDR